MRVVFAGTPEVALPSLAALIASDHEVVAVVTRPDAPAGRGRTLLASPVAELAAWGLAGTRRAPGDEVPALNAGALAIEVYEAQRPGAEAACRIGDERFLALRAARES